MKRKFVTKLLISAFAAGLAFSAPVYSYAGNPFVVEAEAAESTGIPQYRLYNPNSGEHFYTQNVKERNSLVSAGWKYEGYAWMAAKKNSKPVYRLYNPNAGDHHYTTSAKEKNYLVSQGWKYEGVGWYSDLKKGKVVYRLYNPNAKTGSHHYTLSASEKNHLVRLGWRFEGIGFYAVNEKSPADDSDDVNEQYSPKTDFSSLSYYMGILNSKERSVANDILNRIVKGGEKKGYEAYSGLSEASVQRIVNAVVSVYAPCGGNNQIGTVLSSERGYGVYVANLSDAHEIYEKNQQDLNRIHAFIDPYVKGKSESGKVRAIHDRIKSYLEYDNTLSHYSWKAGLESRTGVCQAYSELFHLCALASGLQDRIMTGTADGDGGWGAHGWNYVRVNGTWYYIDVTWDDSLHSDQHYLSRSLWSNHSYEEDQVSGSAL